MDSSTVLLLAAGALLFLNGFIGRHGALDRHERKDAVADHADPTSGPEVDVEA